MYVNLRRYSETDVLIQESTLASCILAWRLAREGVNVTLVTGSTSPMVEMIASMRPWWEGTSLAGVPEPFRQALRGAAKGDSDRGRRMLHAGKWVVAVEDLLLDAGVRTLYNARPAGLLACKGTVTDVVYGGKFGLAALPARLVLDTSHRATLARFAGGRFEPIRSEVATERYLYTLLCADAVDTPATYPLSDPAASGSVRLDGEFAEYRLDFPRGSDSDSGESARRLVDIQRIVCRSLLRKEDPLSFQPFMGPDIALRIPDDRLIGQNVDGVGCLKPDGFDNLLVIGPCAAVDDVEPETFLTEPLSACAWMDRRFSYIAESVRDAIRAPAPQGPRRLVGAGCTHAVALGGEFCCTDPAFSEPDTSELELDLPDLPVIADADVVVIGGGTSGFPAAVTAAEQGLRVVCTEHQGAFGGANTVGGVSKLWFGHWNPFFQRYYLRVRRAGNGVELPTSMAYLATAPRKGLDLLAGVPACGVFREGRNIKGVCVLTENGLAVVRGRQYIDATGDGDTAAWAGNPYTWGSERDEITYWCSFGHFHHGKSEASRQYHSVVDTRSLIDTSRALMVGRRQAGVFGDAEYPQYYLAVRETRHITGRARVSYLDMLMNRHFDDTVLVCQSNIDIKGMHASDAVMAGMIEGAYNRNYRCAIPYRAFLPVAFDNLFILGKAYSISHDAHAMARMQPDMMTLGAVAGFAAAQAHQCGAAFAELDVAELQRRLCAEGILTPCDCAPEFDRLPPDGDELEALVEHVGMCPAELSAHARILSAGPAAATPLARVLESVPNYIVPPLARLLCMLRHPAGADIPLRNLAALLEKNGPLPTTSSDGRHLMPDHGWAPPPVHDINALALLGDTRLIPLLEKLATRLTLDPDHCDSRFNYVHAIAYAFERLADPAGRGILEALLKQPVLRDSVLPRDGDPRDCVDDVRERHDYLALCLARALARCGGTYGYQRLIDTFADHRLHLARSAWRELRELTGECFGFDPELWREWLRVHSDAPGVWTFLGGFSGHPPPPEKSIFFAGLILIGVAYSFHARHSVHPRKNAHAR